MAEFNKSEYNAIDRARRDIKEVQKNGDIEIAHDEADNVLCNLLKALDLNDIVEDYYKIEKWYA